MGAAGQPWSRQPIISYARILSQTPLDKDPQTTAAMTCWLYLKWSLTTAVNTLLKEMNDAVGPFLQSFIMRPQRYISPPNVEEEYTHVTAHYDGAKCATVILYRLGPAKNNHTQSQVKTNP